MSLHLDILTSAKIQYMRQSYCTCRDEAIERFFRFPTRYTQGMGVPCIITSDTAYSNLWVMQVCLLVSSTSEATSSGLSVGRLRVKFSAVDNSNNITNNRNNRKIVVMITIVTLGLGL